MTIVRINPKRPITPPQLSDPIPSGALPTSPPPAVVNRTSNELITPNEAAERLSVTAKVLERWRGAGNGPAFVKLTSKTIRYRHEDLDAFIAGHQQTSTAAA